MNRDLGIAGDSKEGMLGTIGIRHSKNGRSVVMPRDPQGFGKGMSLGNP